MLRRTFVEPGQVYDAIADLKHQLDMLQTTFVPRPELEVRWRVYDATAEQVGELQRRMDRLQGSLWVLATAMSAVIPLAVVVLSKIWR